MYTYLGISYLHSNTKIIIDICIVMSQLKAEEKSRKSMRNHENFDFYDK